MTTSSDNPRDIARRVLSIEQNAINAVAERLGDELGQAVDLILAGTGKVIVTGMGKSGHIARKIAATLASTGTPAVFVHPAEGMHGDLGVIAKTDIVIAISYSGNTPEIVSILPAVRRIGAPLIAMTGHATSPLGASADIVLDVAVPEEACPLGLAPTASTTATLALGDALAVVLLEKRGFTHEDFALFHPGGALGKRLTLCVRDLMRTEGEVPRVPAGTLVSDAVIVMSASRLGITGVFERGEGGDLNAGSKSIGRLIGCVTDGDLRRALQKHGGDAFALAVDDIMTRSPLTVPETMLAYDALRFMDDARVSVVFASAKDDPDQTAGIVHMHDILKAGLG
ncbi:KpsF/GutQ family sugar-phosphate isomerase [bacterium]|nr:KpsF/GutQ family sugar-phosphate isomerase [bacterium]